MPNSKSCWTNVIISINRPHRYKPSNGTVKIPLSESKLSCISSVTEVKHVNISFFTKSNVADSSETQALNPTAGASVKKIQVEL